MSKFLETVNSQEFFSIMIQVPLRQITLYIICSNASIAEVIIMGYSGGGYGGYGAGAGFALIVVLFILLIIVGAAYVY